MRTPSAVLVCFLLLGCDDRPAQWDAFVTYQEDPERLEIIAGFKTFELCQSAALQRLRAEKATETGYYECGFKCEYKPEYKTSVCKETRD